MLTGAAPEQAGCPARAGRPGRLEHPAPGHLKLPQSPSVRSVRRCAPVSPGAQLLHGLLLALPVPRTTTRATCGSWSDAWSVNSALTCTESYSGVGVSSSFG